MYTGGNTQEMRKQKNIKCTKLRESPQSSAERRFLRKMPGSEATSSSTPVLQRPAGNEDRLRVHPQKCGDAAGFLSHMLVMIRVLACV